MVEFSGHSFDSDIVKQKHCSTNFNFMSTSEPRKLAKGQPALLKHEIERIKNRSEQLDVLVIGMNPSLSQRTYRQLYNRLKKRKKEDGLLNLLDELSERGGQNFIVGLNHDHHWRNWVQETFSKSGTEVFSRLQYYSLEGEEKPSIDDIHWPSVSLDDNLVEKRTINYFDTIRRTLAAGLQAMQVKSNLDKRTLTWYQIDLFHQRETNQELLLSSLKDGKEWNAKAEKSVTELWEQIKFLNPRLLLVANSNVTDLIFTNYEDILGETFNFSGGSGHKGFGKELFWDEKSFTLRIKTDATEQMPKVVFSRQLSGGASNAMLYYVAKEIGRMLSSED